MEMMDTSVRDTSVRDTSSRDTSVRDTSVKDTSVRDTSVRDTSARDTSARDASVMEMSALPAATTAVDLGGRHPNATEQQRRRDEQCRPKLSHWCLLRGYLSVKLERPYRVRPARPDRRAGIPFGYSDMPARIHLGMSTF